MDNAQVLMLNLTLATLLGVFVLIASVGLYMLSIRRTGTNARVIGSMLLGVAVVLVLLMVQTINTVQQVNPLCAGVGDPQAAICVGRGLVAQSEADGIMAAKLYRDLFACLVAPGLLGVGLCYGVLYYSDRVRRAGL